MGCKKLAVALAIWLSLAGVCQSATDGCILVLPRFDKRLWSMLEAAYAPLIEELSREQKLLFRRRLDSISTEEYEGLYLLAERADRVPFEERLKVFAKALVNTKAPIAYWEKVKAYATASSCGEDKLHLLRQVAEEEKKVLSTKDMTDRDWQLLIGMARLREGRCVPISVLYSESKQH